MTDEERRERSATPDEWTICAGTDIRGRIAQQIQHSTKWQHFAQFNAFQIRQKGGPTAPLGQRRLALILFAYR
jgi:hypothetical protein